MPGPLAGLAVLGIGAAARAAVPRIAGAVASRAGGATAARASGLVSGARGLSMAQFGMGMTSGGSDQPAQPVPGPVQVG